jgi:predicted dehydrogenase
MTTDAGKCRAILEAEKRYKKKVVVTFNYRYAPFPTKVKKLIKSGIIGDIFSIHFEWLLDRNMDVSAHGTSYFRRWNSRMDKSGGLLVHKSTHHFDIINWWLEDSPEKVSAFGSLNLYGTPGSNRYANGIKGINCRSCGHIKECEFFYRLNDFEKEFYQKNEHYDNYFKDGCVYSADIDIYDTMSLNVRYKKGALLSYSLNATCAYEGWRASINGSNGRIEAYTPETGPDFNPKEHIIRVFDLDNNVTEYKIQKSSGGHGGGDERLLKMLFVDGTPDPLGHSAGTREGADSILIGAAANISIRDQIIVDVSSLR